MTIDYRDQSQIELLSTLKRRYGAEFDKFPPNALSSAGQDSGYHFDNDMFGSVDAEVLYAMVRMKKPKAIVEIGSGWTTRLMVEAVRRNVSEGFPCTITSIDPAGKDGQHAENAWIVRDRLENVPATLDKLEPGDFLVADTSHLFVEGGEIDVVLKKLPSLAGVYVHFHDIFLPSAYPASWGGRYYTEQDHLQAFLEGDSGYEVVLAANYLHEEQPALLAATFQSYDRDRPIGPGSFWISKPTERVEAATAELFSASDPHEFTSDRSGKKCFVCGKTVRAKVHA